MPLLASGYLAELERDSTGFRLVGVDSINRSLRLGDVGVPKTTTEILRVAQNDALGDRLGGR